MTAKKESKTVSVVAKTSFVAHVNGADMHFVPDTPYELDRETFKRLASLFMPADEWLKGRSA